MLGPRQETRWFITRGSQWPSRSHPGFLADAEILEIVTPNLYDVVNDHKCGYELSL